MRILGLVRDKRAIIKVENFVENLNLRLGYLRVKKSNFIMKHSTASAKLKNVKKRINR